VSAGSTRWRPPIRLDIPPPSALPLGVQAIAAPWREDHVLCVARATVAAESLR
jgi:Asp-tRNA(Asn)/Glu-tRNA(Gln) amidotransferase A subunit family amidase